ncbi:MAG TPA: DUF5343 domain-containing protein [Balneolaceae bacterium]|nr:DUF5343 domain-containing protein [Balneolaceae bacterium]
MDTLIFYGENTVHTKSTIANMKVSEAFLVNTKNFESIIDALVKYDSDEVINSSVLEVLGYSDPNDLLVVRLLKDFNIITNDGEPGEHYDEFKDPDSTKKALAKGLIEAYAKLFEVNPKIHQASIDTIKETFEELFDGKKTELIIKYISSTFQKVVSYVGTSTIDAIREQDQTETVTSTLAETVEINSNGHQQSSDQNLIRESIGDKNIDDLVNDFDAKKSGKEENKEDDDELNLTIREYVEDETEEKVNKEEDPFGFTDEQDTSEMANSPDNDTNMDKDPVDLEAPLSSVNSQSAENMATLTTDNSFVQKALIRKSDLLNKLQRWDELLPTLEEIITRYDDENEHPSLKEAVSRSIIRQAVTLLKLNRPDEALPALTKVIDRFKDSPKKEFYDQASKAMLFKAQILEKDESSDLLPLYNMIIERMDSSSEILVKEKLDQVYLKRYDLIIDNGSRDEILDASNSIIKRFKGQNDYREYLQVAMMKRAEILDELGHDEEALKAYDEFLAAFGD